mmetsp:Transcript_9184/g.12631  ORF Transcript_9184/g.12631 Transcript_9184/m.12631 type:complete len:89 (-) Transcript_9184:712-978(-)
MDKCLSPIAQRNFHVPNAGAISLITIIYKRMNLHICRSTHALNVVKISGKFVPINSMSGLFIKKRSNACSAGRTSAKHDRSRNILIVI